MIVRIRSQQDIYVFDVCSSKPIPTEIPHNLTHLLKKKKNDIGCHLPAFLFCLNNSFKTVYRTLVVPLLLYDVSSPTRRVQNLLVQHNGHVKFIVIHIGVHTRLNHFLSPVRRFTVRKLYLNLTETQSCIRLVDRHSILCKNNYNNKRI